MEKVLSSARAQLVQEGVLYMRIKVATKSARTELVDIMDDGTWKIRLKAAPEKGRANEELRRYVAQLFGLQKNQIVIVSGETDRVKLVKLQR